MPLPLEHLRNISFWILDFIKGSKTKKHLNEIKLVLDNYNNNDSKANRDNNLESLLKHAVNTTRFYKKISNYKSLTRFEVINKNTIRNNIEDFKSNRFINKKTFKSSTSGSTGASLTVYHDKNKKIRNNADTIYFSKKSGYKIGYKLFYIRHWGGLHKKSKIISWIQNIIPIEVINLNDETMASFISRFKNDRSNKVILGYASAFELICKYLDKINATPIDSNIRSIIAMSENLNSYTKKAMGHYFKCTAYSRYSNMENGILAQQTNKNIPDFTLNWASYYIEILNINNNQPAKKGNYGRIVVTDLFNYAMPLIRYDTGDLGILDYTKSPPTLKTVDGRKSDSILNTKGDIITSFIITNLYNFDKIIQSQLIQETKKQYTLKLNVEGSFTHENEIINTLKKHLGQDAIIKVIYVNEIPLLASGKRKATVNNFLK